MTTFQRPTWLRRRRNLSERLSAYVQPIEERLDLKSTRPLRNWLLAWQVWTGDPPSTIARGLGLDPDLVRGLLADGSPGLLAPDSAACVADALGTSVADLFGQAGCDRLWSEMPGELAAVLRNL